jgi:hypothetical protein
MAEMRDETFFYRNSSKSDEKLWIAARNCKTRFYKLAGSAAPVVSHVFEKGRFQGKTHRYEKIRTACPPVISPRALIAVCLFRAVK